MLSTLRSGIAQFWTSWANRLSPPPTEGPKFPLSPDTYAIRWAIYSNTIFEDPERWHEIFLRGGLYRDTKADLNELTRLVNLYVSMVYRGALSEDGKPFTDGTELAIPLPDTMNDNLRSAIAQLWQWSRFERFLKTIVLWTAALGECLVEVVDDVQRGQVYYEQHWPGNVTDLALDQRRACTGYTLEYPIMDADGWHHFKKVVTKTEIRTYRDDLPYSYDGLPAARANPYGFVPAYWFMHRDIGGDHGAPAYGNSATKMLRIMSLAAHLSDHAHKRIDSPMLVATNGSLELPLFRQIANAVRRRELNNALNDAGWRTDRERRSDDRRLEAARTLPIIKAPQGTTAQALAGGLSDGEGIALVELLLKQLSKDFPILEAYESLRQMQQIHGPSVVRLLGDVNDDVTTVQGQYDPGIKALLQMGVTIGAFRYSEAKFPLSGSGWSVPSPERDKFRFWDLGSYHRGELNFDLPRRPVVSLTQVEQAELSTARYGAIQSGVKAGIPLAFVLKREGWDENDITEVERLSHEAQVAAAAVAATPSSQNGRSNGTVVLPAA